MLPFGLKQIIGISSWGVLVIGLLTFAGFFAFPVFFFMCLIYGLALFFGKKA